MLTLILTLLVAARITINITTTNNNKQQQQQQLRHQQQQFLSQGLSTLTTLNNINVIIIIISIIIIIIQSLRAFRRPQLGWLDAWRIAGLEDENQWKIMWYRWKSLKTGEKHMKFVKVHEKSGENGENHWKSMTMTACGSLRNCKGAAQCCQRPTDAHKGLGKGPKKGTVVIDGETSIVISGSRGLP